MNLDSKPKSRIFPVSKLSSKAVLQECWLVHEKAFTSTLKYSEYFYVTEYIPLEELSFSLRLCLRKNFKCPFLTFYNLDR